MDGTTGPSAPLWRPPRERIEKANITAFRRRIEQKYGVELKDYDTFYDWSLEHAASFWAEVWSFCGVIGDWAGGPVLEHGGAMLGTRWFPGARLNFAENLLRRRGPAKAIVFWGEDKVRRCLSHDQLRSEVFRLARALRAVGVQPGDRIAGYLPNTPETTIAALAATSLGAIWASCSPDFGAASVLDRFGQIEPRVLFAADGYFYDGRWHSAEERVCEVAEGLPSVETFVRISYRDGPTGEAAGRGIGYGQFVEPFDYTPIRFERFPFDHPLYILFSSGTTGVPKGIIHGAGGTLIQHLKEHVLHGDVKPSDRIFCYTTCGWMMWNWLLSTLAAEGTLLLYDGSPFAREGSILFDLADEEGMTHFGTSAKFIDAARKRGLAPLETHDLSTLHTVFSTGSPLVPESFDFVYERIKEDLCLSSISGGTDIVSCFVLGNPALPVWRGEIQCRGLGMSVEVFDEQGHSVVHEKGELVCTAPFPSMPVGFWNDAEGAKYRAAYFETYPGVWCHGDYAKITARGGVVIYGRSDTALNPGGVRIGTTEVYRPVEEIDEVLESVVVGQNWSGDVRIVLFVQLRPGVELDDQLVCRIKERIRSRTSHRHVPARVISVRDIPRTRSGKIAELAVRAVVHGEAVTNHDALANPESLAFFADLPELAS